MDKDRIHNIINQNMLGGLNNIGNTCCFNTALQCLYNVTRLNKYLTINKTINNELNVKSDEYDFTLAYRETLTYLLSQQCYRPNNLLRNINRLCNQKKIHLNIGNQEDSHEILIYFLDWLHESLKYNISISIEGELKNDVDKLKYESYKQLEKECKNNYSIIKELFTGQFLYKVFSDDTKKEISYNFEQFNSLQLEITDHTNTIEDCFKSHMITKFSGENKYFYEKNNTKIDATRVCYLWNLPQYLILSFKRFNYDGTKNRKGIKFPIDNFNLYNYISGYNSTKGIYDLISIGLHRGSLNFGHYYAITRKTKNIWLLYNDETRNKIDNIEDEVKSKLSDVYFLIYKKNDGTEFEDDQIVYDYINKHNKKRQEEIERIKRINNEKNDSENEMNNSNEENSIEEYSNEDECSNNFDKLNVNSSDDECVMFDIPDPEDIDNTTIYTEYSKFSPEDYEDNNISDEERFNNIAKEVGLHTNDSDEETKTIINESLSQEY